jgi:hypothetical protein
VGVVTAPAVWSVPVGVVVVPEVVCGEVAPVP